MTYPLDAAIPSPEQIAESGEGLNLDPFGRQGIPTVGLGLRIPHGIQSIQSSLYVASPDLLARLGIDAATVHPSVDVITTETGDLVLTDVALFRKRIEPEAMPAAVIGPSTTPASPISPRLCSPNRRCRAMAGCGARAGWFIETDHAITAAQRAQARDLAVRSGLTIETRDPKRGLFVTRLVATTAGMLLALAILAMTIGLIRGEASHDLQTLTATGATSSVRRTLTAATAAALALARCAARSPGRVHRPRRRLPGPPQSALADPVRQPAHRGDRPAGRWLRRRLAARWSGTTGNRTPPRPTDRGESAHDVVIGKAGRTEKTSPPSASQRSCFPGARPATVRPRPPTMGQCRQRRPSATCLTAPPVTAHRRLSPHRGQRQPTGPDPADGRACAAVYDHVIWIWMENKNLSAVLDSTHAPFMSSLAESCGTALQFVDHGVSPSLPNYIAATSGDTQGVHDDALPSSHPLDVDNIFRQVRALGKTAKSYEEAMPAQLRACDRPVATR